MQLLGPEPGRIASAASAPVMLVPWADPPAAEERERRAFTAEPDALREIEHLRLGIAQSPHDSENWIGFADPTPHSAPLSEVEQPALDPDAGNPGRAAPAVVMAGDQRDAADRVGAANAVPEHAIGARETSAAAGTAGAERKPEARAEEEAEARREGETVGADALEDSAAVAGAPEEGPDDAARPLMGEVSERVIPAADERDAAFVGPPREAARAVSEATTPGAGAQREIAKVESGTQSPGAAPGERSERESNAVSREMAIEVRPGRPAAAEGLEIITRRPEFSRVTRLMAAPARNPRLRVTFDREGLVRNVEFIEATGIRDVDDPVQHAVYRWTARGRALAELPATDPLAGVTITVTILLR